MIIHLRVFVPILASLAAAVGGDPEIPGYFIVVLNIVVVVSFVLPRLMRLTFGQICSCGKDSKQQSEYNIPMSKEHGSTDELEMTQHNQDLMNPQIRENPYVPSVFHTRSGINSLGTDKLRQMATDYVNEATELQRLVRERQVASVFHKRKRLGDMKNALINALQLHRETAKQNAQ